MRINMHHITTTALTIAMCLGCAKKDEQMEDPLSSEFSDGISDPGYDFFGGNESFELTEEFAPIGGESSFGELDPYSDGSMAGVDLGYTDESFSGSEGSYDFAADLSDSYEMPHHESTVPATPTTTMPSRRGVPSSELSGRYVVQPGDTLAIIARRVYQDINRWRDLASLNNISNPSLIHPGDVIVFDVNDSKGSRYAQKQDGGFQTVTVQRGDTLASIAERVLGTSLAWKYLWRFNEDTIKNPHRIHAGQQLRYRHFDRNGRGMAH